MAGSQAHERIIASPDNERTVPGGSQLVDAAVSPSSVLEALPDPILVLDADDRILWVNPAAEQFLGAGAVSLAHAPLSAHVDADNPLQSLVKQARGLGAGLSDRDVVVAGPRMGSRRVDVKLSIMEDGADCVLVSLVPQTIAETMGRQMNHRGAARSVMAVARLLAHEVKNPLSGIRGAAQLLEEGASEDDLELTKLIRDETDRVCSLIDSMDRFAEEGLVKQRAVNIHEVLSHVRRLAVGGFARDLRFSERYDPSLPPASGDRNALIQVFLNLLKNAAEAVPRDKGEVTLATAYRQGVWAHLPESGERISLPLEVTVADNGPGIPEEVRANLFDAFVTTKPDGTGLGLALVAKLVRDHGGVVEYESVPRRTEFRIRLPLYGGGSQGVPRGEARGGD